MENKKFEWNDDLVKEFANSLPVDLMANENVIEEFKKSKTPIPLMKDDASKDKKCNTYTIQEGDTFKGQIVTDVRLEDNICVFKTEPKEEQKEWEILQYYPPEVSDCTARIYSVKRNRDGEIFSIGDRIEFTDNTPNQIVSITIKGGHKHPYLWLCADEKQGYGQSLLSAEKLKNILLTTTDGIPIYDNDRVIWTITGAGQIVVSSAEFVNPSLKYFSSKEKAEEYKLWSEQRYSLNDINSILDEYVYPFAKKAIIDKLKQHK